MALTDPFRTDKSFKHAFDYTQTEAYVLGGKRWYEEIWKTKHEQHISEIWADVVPYNDLSGAVAAGVVEKLDDIQLTPDPGTLGDRCWVFCATPGDINTRYLDLVHPIKYGANFTILLRDNMGATIQATWDWTADYTAGIVVFENAPAYPKPYFGTAYRYIGAYGAASAAGSGGCLSYSKVIHSWTMDGAYQYADVIHTLGTENLLLQLTDPSSQEYSEIQNYKITDPNTVRVWVTSGTISSEVSIVACGGTNSFYTGRVNSWNAQGSYYYRDIVHSLNSEFVDLNLYDVSSQESVPYNKFRVLDDDSIRIWVNQDIPLDYLVLAAGGTGGGGTPPYREDIAPTISMGYWDISHNLGRDRLLVNCFDIYGDTMVPWHITYVDDNRLRVYWEKPAGIHSSRVPAGTIVCY